MALINCPECNKEISDKSTNCIHCGFPLSQSEENLKLKKIILERKNKSNPDTALFVMELLCIKFKEACRMTDNFPCVIIDGVNSDIATEIANKITNAGSIVSVVDSDEIIEKQLPSKTPKEEAKIACPKCKSTQINAGTRGFSIVTGFIGSGNTIITCLKCGWKWKPGK